MRAFRLEKLDAVVLHRGTWHWGPFPLGDEPVLLFNVQGLGYARDNASADLAVAGRPARGRRGLSARRHPGECGQDDRPAGG